MTLVRYEQLALNWSPERGSDRHFKQIAVLAVGVSVVLGALLSSIELPKERREAHRVVPERIANFIMERDRPKPKPKPEPQPKREVPKPAPKPVERPREARTSEKSAELKKPLTKAQKKARDKAAESGLLALSGELASLMDTSRVSRELGGAVVSRTGAVEAAGHDTTLLTADIGKGGGGVKAGEYTSGVIRSKLTQREITQVRQSLVADTSADPAPRARAPRSGNVRVEEEITVVFDQNKSVLYSIYNRERRKNPDLKGRIVLEITIAASGKVTAIRVVSSELGDPQLEKRLLSRIKLFDFGAQDVKPVTVTYPIEFLPS